MPPRWSLDGSALALPEEDSCSSSIVSGLSSSEVHDGLIDQRDEEENSLSSSISSTHHRKTVTFQELATVYLFQNCGHPEEAHEESNASSSSTSSGTRTERCFEYCSWYNHAELRDFKLDILETVDRIVAGDTGGGDREFCSRGCEYRTPMGTVLRQKHRRDGLDAVLGYQLEQRQRGKRVDPDLLARVYLAVTHHSQTVAQVMGNIDQSSVAQKPPSSPSVSSDVDASVSNRVGREGTLDCSKLELEQVQQKHLQNEFFHLPSPPAFAFRRNLFRVGHAQSG